MSKNNFSRMIQLAEEVFAVKEDANQLDVDESVIAKLLALHPATVSEFADENGPAVWILIIPTSLDLMNKFLQKKISEKELFELTNSETKFEAIYLCSAMVLEEYRGKGIAKRLTIEAIEKICKVNKVQNLFVWPFSKEGDGLAEKISEMTRLELLKREK